MTDSPRVARRFLGSVAGLVALVQCGGGGGGGGGGNMDPVKPPPIVANYSFPPGHASAPSGVAWDIVHVRTTLSQQFASTLAKYDTLRVDVTFAQDISSALPAPGQPLATGNQLGVQISIDPHNPSIQKIQYNCDPAGSASIFSFYSLETDRLLDGNYSIVGPGGILYTGPPNLASEAVTSVSGHTLTESFFMPTVGIDGSKNPPAFGIGVDALNGVDKLATSCVPYPPKNELP